MSRWGIVIRCCSVVAGFGLMLAGCGSNTSGSPQASGESAASSTTLPPAPSAFDPCSSAMQPVLESEQLDSQNKASSDGNGGVQLRGCSWVSADGDGYAVSIQNTNITLPMIRANDGFKVAEELSIDGRAALTYHDSDATDLKHDCQLNVELKGGSLNFLLDNPPSRKRTGSMDTCEIAKNLARKVVPLIPASA